MAKILTDQNYIDNVQATFGTSGDLQIHHDGSNSYVSDVGTGSLILTGTDLQLKSAGDEYFMYGAADGQVSLYHNGIKKFETSSIGVSITGSMVSSSVSTSAISVAGSITVTGTVDGRDVAADGTKLDGIASGATANTGTVTGTGNSSSVAVWTNSTNIIDGPITFSSNDATFAGTVKADGNIALGNISGVARLQHEGSGQLKMLSSGDSLIGTFTSTGTTFASTVTTGGDLTIGGTGGIFIPEYIYHTGDGNTYFGFNANDQFRVSCAGNTKLNITSTRINTYSAEITTSGSPQYFTYGGSGSQQLVFREDGPGGYKNSIIAQAGGGVTLYYSNSEKLTTVSGGVSLGNNTLYLGQYSGISLNGTGPSAGKVIAGTGTSSQLIWVDSVSNITVGTGLDISSSTSSGAITKNITLDFNELPVIDGDDPQADWFIVESSEDENSKINYSDLQNVDAHWKTFQTVITSNFDDRSSSTGIWYMPLNYISETTSANYYNTFACPRGGTVKRIMMMHTAGSTMSTFFTTELSILKNALSTSFSGELTPSNGSNDGSNITWSPNYTFTAGDRLNFRYQKSATSKYWYGVSVSIIIEFDTI